MSNAQWFLLLGGLLLARGVTASALTRLPVTPAIIYLAVGLVVGPTVLNVFHFNPLKQSALLEVLTEVVVLISLFSAGVKMPVPVSLARWRTPILLATVSMTMTVASVLVGMLGTRTAWPIRGMVGWFGVRGIGSLYYLMYAIQHGIAESLALELIQFTLVVVSLSILAHGTSVKPLTAMFWRHRRSLPAP
jgi:NhaP-type Na+/H+ or K+/H+ antiporter